MVQALIPSNWCFFYRNGFSLTVPVFGYCGPFEILYSMREGYVKVCTGWYYSPRSGKKINSVFYFFHGIANIEHGNSNHTLHEVVHDHYYLDQAHHNN
jgi:hypothetical protein